MIIAREIMESLREMFGQTSTQIKHDALMFIFNARMKEGTSIPENVLNMMINFNVAVMDGVVIDKSSQVSFILETLLKSFMQFISNVVMNDSLTTLLNEPQTYRSLMKKQRSRRR